MSPKNKAILAVLIANFFFGTSVIAVKHVTPLLITPIAFTAIRVVGSAILFWLAYAMKPIKTPFTKNDYYILIICAITGISMNQSFSIKGMSLTSPIHASLLILTTPMVITIFAAIFLKERLSINKIVGILLGISGGILLIFSRDVSAINHGDQTLGDLFVVLGAISYSAYVILMKPIAAKFSSSAILKWVFLIAAFISLPLAWNDLTIVHWDRFDALSWFCLSYSVIGATFIAYRLMNYGISKLEASVAGSFIYSNPFFATIASMLILNEKLTFTKIAAASLIFGGVFLANYRKRPSIELE